VPLGAAQITERTQKRERAAAAAAEGLEDAGAEEEGEESLGADDDVVDEGFGRFIAADEDSEPAFLMYEDEMDGVWDESDFVDREEAEEGEEGDGQQQAGQGGDSVS
jgi:hypothetical protein